MLQRFIGRFAASTDCCPNLVLPLHNSEVMQHVEQLSAPAPPHNALALQGLQQSLDGVEILRLGGADALQAAAGQALAAKIDLARGLEQATIDVQVLHRHIPAAQPLVGLLWHVRPKK